MHKLYLLNKYLYYTILLIVSALILCYVTVTEEVAADDKKGKLYKPKSRISEAKTVLPLETPPQFLAIDKRNVSFFDIYFHLTLF